MDTSKQDHAHTDLQLVSAEMTGTRSGLSGNSSRASEMGMKREMIAHKPQADAGPRKRTHTPRKEEKTCPGDMLARPAKQADSKAASKLSASPSPHPTNQLCRRRRLPNVPNIVVWQTEVARWMKHARQPSPKLMARSASVGLNWGGS